MHGKRGQGSPHLVEGLVGTVLGDLVENPQSVAWCHASVTEICLSVLCKPLTPGVAATRPSNIRVDPSNCLRCWVISKPSALARWVYRVLVSANPVSRPVLHSHLPVIAAVWLRGRFLLCDVTLQIFSSLSKES